MDIIGLGLDATEIDRIAQTIGRYGERFVRRIFTDGEIAYCRAKRDFASSFAARFAAKEAAMKALGTGHTQQVLWRDIEVVRRGGPPRSGWRVGHPTGRHGGADRVRMLHRRSAVASSDDRVGPGAIRCGGSFIGDPSFDVISQPQGRPPILSLAISGPVNTATTPGAEAAPLVLMRLSLALACGLRRI